MQLLRRTGTIAVWIALSVALAVVYGVANDQITVTLSPEYYSVFKRHQFAQQLDALGLADAPTRLQAVAIGTMATWWFGVILGIMLSIAGAVGSRPAVTTRTYLRAVLGIMVFSLALSAVAGLAGYLAEPWLNPTVDGWPFLDGIQNVRAAFAVGFWHDAAYLGGLIGTVGAEVWLVKQRWKRA